MDDFYWLAFTKGFPIEVAKGIFEKKYGKPPKTWKFDGNHLLVGPEPRQTFSNVKNVVTDEELDE